MDARLAPLVLAANTEPRLDEVTDLNTLTHTAVDAVIFVVKIFARNHENLTHEIYLQRKFNATKNSHEIFLTRKFPDLRYVIPMYIPLLEAKEYSAQFSE